MVTGQAVGKRQAPKSGSFGTGQRTRQSSAYRGIVRDRAESKAQIHNNRWKETNELFWKRSSEKCLIAGSKGFEMRSIDLPVTIPAAKPIMLEATMRHETRTLNIDKNRVIAATRNQEARSARDQTGSGRQTDLIGAVPSEPVRFCFRACAAEPDNAWKSMLKWFHEY